MCLTDWLAEWLTHSLIYVYSVFPTPVFENKKYYCESDLKKLYIACKICRLVINGCFILFIFLAVFPILRLQQKDTLFREVRVIKRGERQRLKLWIKLNPGWHIFEVQNHSITDLISHYLGSLVRPSLPCFLNNTWTMIRFCICFFLSLCERKISPLKCHSSSHFFVHSPAYSPYSLTP